MKKTIALLVVLALAFSVTSGPNLIQSAKVAFVNGQSAKKDTIASNDSIWCVIDQRFNGKLADHISIYLPDGLAGGDSAIVYVELLPGNYGAPRAVSANSIIPKRNWVSDQVDPPHSTGTSNIMGSFQVEAGYYDSTGAVNCFTWSPPDSAQCNRVRITLVESAVSANDMQIAGCDSIATTNCWVVWTIEED